MTKLVSLLDGTMTHPELTKLVSLLDGTMDTSRTDQISIVVRCVTIYEMVYERLLSLDVITSVVLEKHNGNNCPQYFRNFVFKFKF